nr:GNAT family N-acetyltransferase [Deinococcus betulae]
MPELTDLYSSVGWTAYTREPQRLGQAVEQSSFLWTAREDAGRLIGLVRGLTDEVSILYVQDILVCPNWQRRGVGRALLDAVLARYGSVMQMVLLTDNDPGQLAFYASLGFQNTRHLTQTPLNAFYRSALGPLS